MERCTMLNCQTNNQGVILVDYAKRIELTHFCFRDSFSFASTNGCLVRVSSDPKEITKLSAVSMTGVTNGDFGVDARRCEINNINISANRVSTEMLNIVSLESGVFHYCYCVDTTKATSGAAFVENLNGKTLDHFLFYNNLGKGIYALQSSISLTECGFASNAIDIYVDSSTVSVTNSQFTDFSSNDKSKVTLGSNCYTKGYGLPNQPFAMENPIGDPNHECNCAQNALSGAPYQPGEPLTAAMTPFNTAYMTPHSTAFSTPFNTAQITNEQTPFNTPIITAKETPFNTPIITAKETPNITPFITPFVTPKEINPDCEVDNRNKNKKRNIRRIKFVLALAQVAQNV
ncbi:hypothetical protein TVAG_258480 [Trichomonas vaginalis G3]|uniref:Right handed beta helix domain-containing protein n=1 Tax=Trichomonas vaginalis (strain ATCC PRA-98 / G3) TaxID=412133 RepID=A2E952_TRIV3|nr:pectin lyase-like family [Trichomonas vaginalis G3]EAY10846.1 hypothetical protein TVAG_258480 [Trichomonas vaginalis G3]KAI5519934.1 pectin lyase-like family [Trichomonas vaginalis G3]|eukprot:XP_001323069.1 hypothetical protein [Trichomonas vaginalis G3]